MAWFDANLLANMRADVANLMPDTCVIKSPTYSTDPAYGWGTATFSPVASGTVACRLDPLGNQTTTQYAIAEGVDSTRKRYRLTVPYDAPLAASYRVEINNTEYEVAQLDDDHSGRVLRRAIVMERE